MNENYSEYRKKSVFQDVFLRDTAFERTFLFLFNNVKIEKNLIDI